MIFPMNGIVVAGPCTTNCSRAHFMREIASSRVPPCTISLAIIES